MVRTCCALATPQMYIGIALDRSSFIFYSSVNDTDGRLSLPLYIHVLCLLAQLIHVALDSSHLPAQQLNRCH